LCWLPAVELVVGVGMVKEMVAVLAACGGGRKKKDAEEENLQRGEGRPRGGCTYRR